MIKSLGILSCVLLLSACSSSNEPVIRDPQTMTRTDYLEVNYRMQPHIKRAKESLPYVQGLYQKGLKEGEKLYVTVKLFEPDKSFEYVDVAVDDWAQGNIMGRIASQVFVLQHYHQGDLINFKAESVVDWTLVKSDGATEGGFVRKFLQGCAANKR